MGDEQHPDDGEIAKLDSIPPGDDAYAAPTKVGEAAYSVLARGMAAFEAPPTPRVPTLPRSPKGVSEPDDGSSLPRQGDDPGTEQLGTVVMPSTLLAQARSSMSPLAGPPSGMPANGPATLRAVPEPVAHVTSSSHPPRAPIPFEPPAPKSVDARSRGPMVIALVTVAVGAFILWLFR